MNHVSWDPTRPRVLVIACSDGRLQEATDEFLATDLGINHYDRLYVPGGAGALTPSGRDYLRALELQKECRYLVGLHGVVQLVAIFHGPATNGPEEAVCADYRRKLPWATAAEIRAQQAQDACELLSYRWQWAGHADVAIYRCDADADCRLQFVPIEVPLPGPNGTVPVPPTPTVGVLPYR